MTEAQHPPRQAAARLPENHPLGNPEAGLERLQEGQERIARRRIGKRPGVLGEEQAGRLGLALRSQEHLSDPPQQGRVPGKPADRVEARRERHDAVEGKPSMARANPEQTAVGSRNANRSSGIAAQREVAGAPGHRRCGAARRPAGNAPRRVAVGRRAIVVVLAVQAVGQLVGDGLADHGGTGIEQALNGRCRCGRRCVRARPIGIAAAGHVTGDIEYVLGREAETRQGPAVRPLKPNRRSRNERSQAVVKHAPSPPPFSKRSSVRARNGRRQARQPPAVRSAAQASRAFRRESGRSCPPAPAPTARRRVCGE